MYSFTDDAVGPLRMRSQRLHPATTVTAVSDAAEALCGVQAQETRSAMLSVRARTAGLVASDVEASLHEERTIVRTWSMRGTLHLVARDDLSWLLSLFGPHFAPRGPEPKQLAEVGFDEAELERTMDAIRRVLDDEGPLTRDELAARLRESGVDVDPTSRTPNFLIRQAALRGVLCEVAPKAGDIAYDVVAEWVSSPAPPDRDVALATLARRYLSAYQPTTLDDFAYWSGLPKRDVRAGWESIADERSDVTFGERTLSMRTADVPDTDPTQSKTTVRFLPGYDTYLLGYRPENRPVPTAFHTQVWPGAGIIRPTVVVDGAVVATWTLDKSASPVVGVRPFEPLDDAIVVGLETEAADLGRFLGLDVEPKLIVEAD
ncbi:Winged helix DNA-binding domain-containing protein [Halogranum rubrum]|uniref:Winged helix DNA-binding domain-containing protein n=1 Tax=Halogranum rubrum TaxID=553466 RepID=A0A1I4F7S0_9EURY|nr:winged helix DNA-binding domain-containing protein [Halogranum rubrum]SFL12461.1 Winged helix DNA-binding domain-containing protein [Halogranum rubrum]